MSSLNDSDISQLDGFPLELARELAEFRVRKRHCSDLENLLTEKEEEVQEEREISEHDRELNARRDIQIIKLENELERHATLIDHIRLEHEKATLLVRANCSGDALVK